MLLNSKDITEEIEKKDTYRDREKEAEEQVSSSPPFSP